MSPLTEIAGEKLNPAQIAYLDGLFAGLRNRGVKFSEVEPNPVATASKPAPDSMILEERIKHELHPLQAYPLILENAAANRPPDKENTFRFKWHGLFYLAPTHDAFMARLRIPGGQLKTFQLREIAQISKQLTTGYIQITSRANLQLRLIQPKDAPDILRRIQNIGLHTRGAGADNIRNLTASPTAGLDPYELIDTLPLCQQLAQLIIHDQSFYNLPRKFNIAFDGGGLISSLEDTNDIGLKAVRIIQANAAVPPGVYFRVALGGATGHKAFGRDLGVLVRPEDVLKVTLALVRVYMARGNRGDRKKARLKHLLESMSLAEYLAETEKLLGFQLIRSPLTPDGSSEIEERRTLPRVPHPHVGVYNQKQAGFHYIGVSVPVGQLTAKQLLRLADLVDNYAGGEVRLTVWHNLIIPNVPAGFVEPLKKALEKTGLSCKQSNLRSGWVACTGNSYCKYAAANTKEHALELMEYLDKRMALDQPINIHLTGCPNSCAQHYIGDIGLLGTQVKVAGEPKEAYHVFVGGGFGDHREAGRQIFNAISFNQLKPTLEKMLRAYLRHRQPAESFREFTRRFDLNSLQALFSNDE